MTTKKSAPAKRSTKKTPAKKVATSKPATKTKTPAESAAKTRKAAPATTTANAPVGRTLAEFLTPLTEKQRTRVTYHATRAAKGGWTYESMSDVEMAMFVRNVGVPAAAAIFAVSESDIRAKRSTAMGATKAAAKPARVATTTTQTTLGGRGRFELPVGATNAPAITQVAPSNPYTTAHGTRQLVDDAHLAVPLHTLRAGQRLKTPDAPRDGIAGQYATLVYISEGNSRARVRVTGTRHISAKANAEREARELDIESSRGVDWSAGTMVVPIADDWRDGVTDGDIERHGKMGALAIAAMTSDVIDDDESDVVDTTSSGDVETLTAGGRSGAAAFVF